MRSYLDRGYSVVKMKIGGAPLAEDLRAHRGGAAACSARARSWPSTPTAASICRPPSSTPRRCRTTTCSGTRKPAIRSTTRCRPSWRKHYADPMATGENLFSMQDARNLIRYGGMRPDRDWLQFDCALSYGLVEYLRTLDDAEGARLVAGALHPARRPPDVAEHRRRPGPRRQRVVPRPVPALRRLSRRRRRSRTATSRCPSCPASASKARPISIAEMRALVGLSAVTRGRR